MFAKTRIAFALFVVLLVGSTNTAYWLAAKMNDDPEGEGSCAVLVLGFPTGEDGVPDPVQRIRVDAGVQAFKVNGCDKLVVTGGAAHNGFVEAQTMADLARSQGLTETQVVLEERATTTWENIGCSIPLVQDFDRVLIVSESLHAVRAKRYACRQDDDLCDRIRTAGVTGPLGYWWWRVPGAMYELRAFVRDKLYYEGKPDANAPGCPDPV